MKWFGRKAGRVAARPFLLRGWPAAGGEPWPRSYEAQMREAYLGNPVAQRAVRLVAEGAASAAVYEEGSPSAASGTSVKLVPPALLEAAAAQLLLHGNAYLQILTDAEGNPAELFPLRPERVGKRRFRLSRLLRGRRGTEWAAPHHGVGEPFALIEAEAFAPIEPPPGITGAEIRLLAQGIGDSADSLPVRRTVEGRALQPPSPVHLGAARTVDGGISIRWVRRSRNGWNWGSEAETPLGEEKESYRLVLGGAGFERALQVGQARYIYTADQQAADGLNGTLRIEVAQIGTHASSRPAVLFFDQQ